ncbi:hypothetical protein NVV31_05070 [Cytobacillus firmus]|uniref:hypothetical protein n=1 Tax=Cytobacillus firmus TaxID=1399 RepID=UPI0021C76A62|nr:hypothetical protein [Cytobacillus firmus]MCU1804768.1 hypothetical protein [Cytobacillus firmus]
MSKSTMFIQPLFDYKPEEWLAMIYGWPPEVKPDSTFLIGFAFKTKEYAREFFDLLRSYNQGEDVDTEDNIRFSLITENLQDYSVYIYPSTDRENVKKFADDSVKEFGDDVQLLIANLTMCKPFPYGEGSTFKRFKEIYIEGNPIELRAFVLKNGNVPEQIEDIKPIIKHKIKIKHRKLLTKDELEYQHGKSIMGK